MKKIVLCLLVLVLAVTACTAVAEGEWTCPDCGKVNTTKYCTSCGAMHKVWNCPNCGTLNSDAFCGECGAARPDDSAGLRGAWKYDSAFDKTYNLVFKENGEWYINSSEGYFHKGRYTVDAKQFAVWTEGTEKQVFDYRVQDGKMRIYQLGYEFIRSAEPEGFVYPMEGESMIDTLYSGDLVEFRFVREGTLVMRFSLVACQYPKRGDTLFIKRVVGVPGDTVELRDGYLYVNGEQYDEPYINEAYRSGYLNSFKAYTVPDGQYFVMGDHRTNSNDSRSIGALDAEMIIGVATAVNGKPIEQADRDE